MTLAHRGRKPNPALNICLLEVCKSRRPPTKIVLHLLELGADPNCVTKKNDTPLHWLCRRGSYNGVKYLLEVGADPSKLNNRLRNALQEACDTRIAGSDQLNIVRALLQHKKFRAPGALEHRDSSGNSALLNAIFSSNVWITRELLLAGALVSDTGIRMGLKDKTSGLSTAYDVALFVYCASLLLDVDQLPRSTLSPNNFLYNYFSLKGNYEWRILLGFQTLWKYSIELVFRMVQRKHKIESANNELKKLKDDRIKAEEERRRKLNPWNFDYSGPLKVHHLSKTEQTARDKARLAKRIQKFVERKKVTEKENLARWNSIRRDMADRIDREFSHQMDGGNRNPHEWVVDPGGTIVAVAAKARKMNNKKKELLDDDDEEDINKGNTNNGNINTGSRYGLQDSLDEDGEDGIEQKSFRGKNDTGDGRGGRREVDSDDENEDETKDSDIRNPADEYDDRTVKGYRSSPKKVWRMVPKQMRSAYSLPPPIPDSRIKDITIEQQVQENFNTNSSHKKLSLSPLTDQERYARQSGLMEVVEDDDDAEIAKLGSFAPAFRRKHAAEYDKFNEPGGGDVSTPDKANDSYKMRYSTPTKSVPTIAIVTSDGKHKKKWKLDERERELNLGFIDPNSAWAKRKLASDVVPPVELDSGEDFNSSDSENDDPYLLY